MDTGEKLSVAVVLILDPVTIISSTSVEISCAFISKVENNKMLRVKTKKIFCNFNNLACGSYYFQ